MSNGEKPVVLITAKIIISIPTTSQLVPIPPKQYAEKIKRDLILKPQEIYVMMLKGHYTLAELETEVASQMEANSIISNAYSILNAIAEEVV